MKIRNLKLGKWNIVLLFFVVMFLCTVVSRAAASMTVPKVKTDNCKSGTLSFIFSGEGSIDAQNQEMVFIPPDGKVLSVAEIGTEVKTGDVLAVFDKEELDTMVKSAESDLKKTELAMEQEKLNLEPSPWVKEQETAQYNLTKVEEQLQACHTKLEQKRAEFQQKISEGCLSEEETVKFDSEIGELSSEAESLEQSLSSARDALDLAKRNDEITEANNKKEQKAAQLSVDSMNIDIAEKKEKLEKLNKLVSDEGRIYSNTDGTVTESTVVIGNITTGAEYLKIGSGNTYLSAVINENNSPEFKEGDQIEVSSSNEKNVVKGKITSISKKSSVQNGSSDNNQTDTAASTDVTTPKTQIMAELEESNLAIGETVEFKVKKESVEYNILLPISAIREDSQGM